MAQALSSTPGVKKAGKITEEQIRYFLRDVVRNFDKHKTSDYAFKIPQSVS